MTWMAETFERRNDPRKLMADAKSIIMLGLNYGPAADPLAAPPRPGGRGHFRLRAPPRLSRCPQG